MIKHLLIACLLAVICQAAELDGTKAYNQASQFAVRRLSKGMTPGQRAAYKAYLKGVEYSKQPDHDKKKLFEMYYGGTIQAVSLLYSPLQQRCEQLREKAEALTQQGDMQGADKMERLAELYTQMTEAISQMQGAYKKHASLPMIKAIRSYMVVEGTLIMMKVKPPQRDWLITEEIRWLNSKYEPKKAVKKNESAK